MTETTGATYDEVFGLLETRAGVEVDVEQAVELWKMHYVQPIIARAGNRDSDSAVFAVYAGPDEPPRHLSWKILSLAALAKILDGMQRSKGRLLKKIDSLDHKITRVKGYMSTRPFDFGSEHAAGEIEEERAEKLG
jgi:hypothetical protein